MHGSRDASPRPPLAAAVTLDVLEDGIALITLNRPSKVNANASGRARARALSCTAACASVLGNAVRRYEVQNLAERLTPCAPRRTRDRRPCAARDYAA